MIRYPGKHPQPMNQTIAAFLRYAAGAAASARGARLRQTSSGSRRRTTSASASTPARSARSWTRSTRWCTRRITPPASTTCPTRTPSRKDGVALAERLPDATHRRPRGRSSLAPGLLAREHAHADRCRRPGGGGPRHHTGGYMLWNAAGVYTPDALRGGPPRRCRRWQLRSFRRTGRFEQIGGIEAIVGMATTRSIQPGHRGAGASLPRRSSRGRSASSRSRSRSTCRSSPPRAAARR